MQGATSSITGCWTTRWPESTCLNQSLSDSQRRFLTAAAFGVSSLLIPGATTGAVTPTFHIRHQAPCLDTLLQPRNQVGRHHTRMMLELALMDLNGEVSRFSGLKCPRAPSGPPRQRD